MINDLLRAAITKRVGDMGQRMPGGVPGAPQFRGGPAQTGLSLGAPMQAPGIPLQLPGAQMQAPSAPFQGGAVGSRGGFDVGRMGDPRGLQGILSRGQNVYGGGSFSSRGSGRPSTSGGNVPREAIARRLGR